MSKREINCVGPVAHRIRILKKELMDLVESKNREITTLERELAGAKKLTDAQYDVIATAEKQIATLERELAGAKDGYQVILGALATANLELSDAQAGLATAQANSKRLVAAATDALRWLPIAERAYLYPTVVKTTETNLRAAIDEAMKEKDA